MKKRTIKLVILIMAFVVLFGVVGLIRLAELLPRELGKVQTQKEQKFTEESRDLEAKGLKEFLNFDLVKPAFAKPVEIKDHIKPILSDTQVKIEEIKNLTSFINKGIIELSDERSKALEQTGFFLTKNNIISDQSQGVDDFVDMYDEFGGGWSVYDRQPENAIFITSDLALHIYHILIDRIFERIEETKLQPLLLAMTKTLFLDAINNYNTIKSTKLKDSYKRLSVYYLVPLVILDTGQKSAKLNMEPSDFPTFAQYLGALEQRKIENSKHSLQFILENNSYLGIELNDEIYNLAKQELELISQANGLAASPLFTGLRTDAETQFLNDYSQFKPRSHYTKNDILKSYFIAMMWYGRMGFTLKSPELTREALIITGQVNNLQVRDKPLSELWSDMAAVIEFFVGETDDLNPYHYTTIIKKVYGNELTQEELSDNKLLNDFINEAVKNLPAPKILSEAIAMKDYDIKTKQELLKETMQFRLMGQRFTPDAYILNKLTQGDEKPDSDTGQKLPSMPTALMLMAVLEPSNQVVKAYFDEWINDPIRIKKQARGPNEKRESNKVIAKFYEQLKQEFSRYNESTWTQNIYWSWLNCFRSLLRKYEKGYPFFMQNNAWLKKNLNTALGSYTELKHDTLLYAKQSYAEWGAGGGKEQEPPPVVRGYVEPDLMFWNKLIALTEMSKQGLNKRNMFPQEFSYKYDNFLEIIKFFRKLAEQELQNQKISDEDFEKLRTVASFQHLQSVIQPQPEQGLSLKEKRAGVIADIHTDAPGGEILYEATGKPYIIYVAVKDINGVRLTRGAVFNHYEFTAPLDGRLSDEDWQAKVYESKGDLPEENKWSKDLIK